jgi:hypothetical protein
VAFSSVSVGPQREKSPARDSFHLRGAVSDWLSGSLLQTNSRMCEAVFSNPPLSQPTALGFHTPDEPGGGLLFSLNPLSPLTKFAQQCERKHVS